MGYTTDFTGAFALSPALTPPQIAYLKKFSENRRMARPANVEHHDDPLRLAVGLPFGPEGAYYTGSKAHAGQDNDAIDFNRPPKGQPGYWCDWVPTDEGDGIVWNEGEKFYDYTEWLNYLIKHFLKPWGIAISGEVEFQGEEPDDFGVVRIKKGRAVCVAGKRIIPS